MACSLEALPHPEGLNQAQELSDLIPQSNPGISDAAVPINQLCIRLQMALLQGDGDKALAIVKDFGTYVNIFLTIT